MSASRWIGIFAAIVLIVSCYLPWVQIPIGNIIVTGMETAGTGFGKPGIVHIVLSVFFMAFTLVPKVWSTRFNLLVVALNTAWAIRNLIIIPACHMGACPEKFYGLYLSFIASVIILLAGLFVDFRFKKP